MSCGDHYAKCGCCGGSVHRNFVCNTCLEKIDPWGKLRRDLEELKELRRQMAIIKGAFKPV